jgi:hypothetical protein
MAYWATTFSSAAFSSQVAAGRVLVDAVAVR